MSTHTPLFPRLAMASLGICAIAFALGTSSALGTAAEFWWQAPQQVREATSAVMCAAITVSAIVVLQRRLNRKPLRYLGLNSPTIAISRFMTGAALCLSTAAVTAALATAAGWMSWGAISLSTFISFLVTNTLIALALEALPEELAIRGYVWNSLRLGGSATAAFILTTVAFLCVVPLSSVFGAGVELLTTGQVGPLFLVPAGENPAQYLFLLSCFGPVLLIARIVTDSVWTGIGFHLTFLTVNRVLFFGDERGTGWDITVHPDALLAVPGYLLLSAVVLLAMKPLFRKMK